MRSHRPFAGSDKWSSKFSAVRSMTVEWAVPISAAWQDREPRQRNKTTANGVHERGVPIIAAVWRRRLRC